MAIPFKTDSGDFGVLTITGSSSADFSAGINSSGANYLERVYFTGADGQWLPVDESADAWTSGSAGKLYYNGGNVGIGTTSPSTRLEVADTDKQLVYLRLRHKSANNSYGAFTTLKSTGSNSTYGTNFSIQTRNSDAKTIDRLHINYEGRVGIGGAYAVDYNSEANDLVISTGGRHAGMTIVSSGVPNARGNIYFASGMVGSDQYRGGLTYDHGDDNLSLRTAATEKVWISSAGNVGIGTNNPSHLLSVSGTTYSQSLFVTGADGSWGQVTTGGGGSVSWDSAPATSTSAGAAGSIAYDSNYYYVCVATNTWKRTSLSSW